MAFLFLGPRKWSSVGLFQFIIIIHLKSFIKIGSLWGFTDDIVACDDLEGEERLGWTRGSSLLKLWVPKWLVNTIQKWNNDLRKAMLFRKRLQMWFTEESRMNIIWRECEHYLEGMIAGLWQLRRDGASNWNIKRSSNPSIQNQNRAQRLATVECRQEKISVR